MVFVPLLVRLNDAWPFVNVTPPNVPLTGLFPSFSVTVNRKFLPRSDAVELSIVFFTVSFPVLRVLVKSAEALVVLISPVISPSTGFTVNPLSDVSFTVYVVPTGIPVMVLVPLCFRENVALPFVKVTPPKVPLTAWPSFFNSTVNSKSLLVSDANTLDTLFLTSSVPVSFLLVKLAADVVSPLIAPVSPVLVFNT